MLQTLPLPTPKRGIKSEGVVNKPAVECLESILSTRIKKEILCKNSRISRIFAPLVFRNIDFLIYQNNQTEVIYMRLKNGYFYCQLVILVQNYSFPRPHESNITYKHPSGLYLPYKLLLLSVNILCLYWLI